MEIYILSLTLFSCLFFCPIKLSDGYILPSMGLTCIGISIVTVFFMNTGNFLFNFTSGLVFFYFLYLMLTNLWSTTPHNSLRDFPLVFASLIGFLVSQVIFQDKNNIVIISLIVFCLSQLTSIYALIQKQGFDPFFPERVKPIEGMKERIEQGFIPDKNFAKKLGIDTRAISTFGNSNFAGGYFCTTLPFLFFLTIEVNTWFALSFILVSLAVLATNSRAALLGCLMAVISFLIMLSSKGIIFDSLFYLFGNTRLEYILLLCIIVFFGGWYLLNIAKEKKWLSGLSEDTRLNNLLCIEDTGLYHWSSHLRYRFRYWQAAWQLIKERPLHGFGLKTYRVEVYRAQRDLNFKSNGKFLGKAYQTPQPRECHNDIIENFVESGFIGGFTFLFIVGLVLFHGWSYAQEINNIKDFILIAGVTSGIIAVLVNANFFFVLRLGPSALLFWLSLSMLETISNPVVVYSFNINVVFICLLILLLIALLWESVIKPNLGNFYFTLSQFSNYSDNKEKYLNQAIKCCPKEGIFRTHALVGYMDVDSLEADDHAEVIRNHYDGMTPAWAARTNMAIIKAKRKDFDKAIQFLRDAINYYPRFQQAQELYNRIFPKASLPRRRVMHKEFEQSAKEMVSVYQGELQNLQISFQSKINETNAMIGNIILSEKLKKNIPIDWICDIKNGVFIPPNEVTNPEQIIEFGPAKIPVLQ